jgi:hypothetical protein
MHALSSSFLIFLSSSCHAVKAWWTSIRALKQGSHPRVTVAHVFLENRIVVDVGNGPPDLAASIEQFDGNRMPSYAPDMLAAQRHACGFSAV